MTEKEQALIAGCLRRDKAAGDAFVLQYSKLAYSTIRKTLTLHHIFPQDDIVEDLHQEFLLSLCENDFRKLRQFKGERGCSLAFKESSCGEAELKRIIDVILPELKEITR